MQFSFMGFSQDAGVRVFTFVGTTTGDRTRTGFSVSADMALSRRYGIHVQELPLLCLRLLERRGEGEQQCAFIFTEEDMLLHASNRAEEREAAQRKKSTRRPPVNQVGTGWRVPQQQQLELKGCPGSAGAQKTGSTEETLCIHQETTKR